jgi:hypothetical protein
LRGGRFEVEEVVGAVEPELAFFLVELAFGIAFFEFSGGFFGGGVAVLLKGEETLAEASEGVEHAEVLVSVVFQLVFAGTGAEVAKPEANLGKGHLETDHRELGGVGIGEGFGKGFNAGAHFFAPELFVDPGVVATFGFPLGDVVDGKGGTVVAELLLNVFVLDAVLDHLVELVADVFGQAGDFAPGPVGGDGVRGRRFRVGGVRRI